MLYFVADKPVTPSTPENPLPGSEDALPKAYQRASHEHLYDAMMHGGGEAFGTPLGAGTTTLTNKTVRRFKKRGYFFMSTYEELDRRRKNPFTKSGSSNMVAEYSDEAIEFALDPSKRKRNFWKRLWAWLWP